MFSRNSDPPQYGSHLMIPHFSPRCNRSCKPTSHFQPPASLGSSKTMCCLIWEKSVREDGKNMSIPSNFKQWLILYETKNTLTDWRKIGTLWNFEMPRRFISSTNQKTCEQMAFSTNVCRFYGQVLGKRCNFTLTWDAKIVTPSSSIEQMTSLCFSSFKKVILAVRLILHLPTDEDRYYK